MRRRALSSRPKQQNSLAKPLRFRGARPFSGCDCDCESLDVEDVGERGMVAFAKMSESALRTRGSMKTCREGFSLGV